MKCEICNADCKSKQSLSRHIGCFHDISKKDYYDKYLKQPNEGVCAKCNNPTKYIDISHGYNKYCCASCQVSSQRNIDNMDRSKLVEGKNKKILLYEHENNCTHIKHLVEKYGRVVYSLVSELSIELIYLSTTHQYVKNEDIDKIENAVMHRVILSGRSKTEKKLLHSINYTGQIIENTKSIIYPYELDIYIPDLKLAIEYNGTYHHCIEKGCDKFYHLDKSLLCRAKGIRLIHVYEFEDLDNQIKLINKLINGIDEFNSKDFNKNNLIKTIPTPKCIYVSPRHYTIYGVGKLY